MKSDIPLPKSVREGVSFCLVHDFSVISSIEIMEGGGGGGAHCFTIWYYK